MLLRPQTLLSFVVAAYALHFLGCFVSAECGKENAIETSGDAPLDQVEVTHDRARFYNWDYKDLGTSAFEDITNDTRHSVGYVDVNSCPDGWIRFSDSCYYIETELLGFSKAEKRCFEKGSTLFVANSLDEWDTVRQNSPKAYFSWIGSVRFTQYEKTETLPRWQTQGGMNPSEINWLVRPYTPISNGWNSLANCVVYYNAPVLLASTSYVFYYPCTIAFYSICERNSTLINGFNNQFD